jgi:hypothetical protein
MVSPWMQHGTLLKHIERLGGPQNANVDKYVCPGSYEAFNLLTRPRPTAS